MAPDKILEDWKARLARGDSLIDEEPRKLPYGKPGQGAWGIEVHHHIDEHGEERIKQARALGPAFENVDFVPDERTLEMWTDWARKFKRNAADRARRDRKRAENFLKVWGVPR